MVGRAPGAPRKAGLRGDVGRGPRLQRLRDVAVQERQRRIHVHVLAGGVCRQRCLTCRRWTPAQGSTEVEGFDGCRGASGRGEQGWMQ